MRPFRATIKRACVYPHSFTWTKSWLFVEVGSFKSGQPIYVEKKIIY